ncbi:MAG: hypothetical protein AAF192_15915 [Pseudomonadota bacterium]
MATTAPSIVGATQADAPVGLDALSLHETVRTGPLTLFSLCESATGEAQIAGDVSRPFSWSAAPRTC